MEFFCHSCGKQVETGADCKVSCRDECSHCGEDLHSCLNCRHYSEQAYNNCKEPLAERVLEKARNNYCDYFEMAQGSEHVQQKHFNKDKYLKDLDDLFKRS